MQSQIEGFRLSPQQKRLWLLRQGHGAAYVSQCTILVEGELRAGALASSVDAAVRRHEILRTTFYRPPGIKIPIQLINDSSAPAWREARPAGKAVRDEAEALLAVEAETPFDFERGPLLRLALLALSPRRHLLVATLPALCADSRTLKNLFDEVVRTYGASDGGGAQADEPVQYVQFAEWQNELLEDAEAAAGREHWCGPRWERLAAPQLPFETSSPPRAAFEPRAHAIDVGPELSEKILSAAARRGATAHDFLLACWQSLLWRLSGEREFLLGYRVAGRKYEELEEAFGLFEKFVPVRADLEGSLTFDAFLGRARGEAEDAAAWHEYFTGDGESKAAPDAADVPFFPVCFEYEELPPCVSAGGAHFSVLSLRGCSDRFKLKLSSARDANSLLAELRFDPSAFGDDGVRCVAEHFAVLLESAADAAHSTRLGDLEILSDEKRRMLLVELNQSAADYPGDLCAHELFERQAARTPARVAVRFGESFLTYAELNRRANRLAHYLRRRGVSADTPVAFCVERSPLMIVGLLGILKAGGAYVPLDPDHPKARLAYQLDDTRAAILVTQESLLDRFEDFAGEFVRLDDETLFAREPEHSPAAATGPQNLCYVIYTSGSTGRPKGVAVSHGSLVNYSLFICRLVRRAGEEHEASHFATVTTLSADLGNTVVFPSLFSGACLHVFGYEVATDGQAFARYAYENSLDVLKIVPSHLRALLASREKVDYLPRNYLVLGGEALPPELVVRVREGSAACCIVNHYGPTETTVGSLTYVVPDEGARQGHDPASIPIGRPIANTEVFIMDAEMKLVPPGVPGELYIGGAGLARGYLNKPAQTAERFVPHLFANREGARLYRTGDLVKCLPDGQVEFLGRVDHQVKVRGFRIELGEIEAALAQHPDVREAIVLAREDEPGRKRLVAYVVPERVAVNLLAELRGHLAERLPEYMVPSAFVTLKALPLTTNGKVDRKALPAPDEAALHGGRAYVAPRNRVEQTLAEIWAPALGVERVGVHDNFFELGGDSILSIQIIARANRAGLRLTLKQLFEHRTIDELAAVAVAEVAADADDGPVTGELPLTPIQRWFFDLGLADPQHFNQSLLFEPARSLDPAALRAALALLLSHHDELRARFRQDGRHGWRQAIAAPDAAATDACFEHIDISSAGEGQAGSALEAEAERLQRALDLTGGPLVKLALFELGGGRQRLLMVVHHLVVDGVSWRVLLEDMQSAYEQLSRGEEARLAPKTASFKRWAEHLREYGGTDEVKKEAAYWTSAERAAMKGLPVDGSGENRVESGRGVTVGLSRERTGALLREVGRAYGTQINEVLVAAVGEAVRRWTGERRVLIDLEGHGREEAGEGAPDVSRTVGWFTSSFPLLLKLGEGYEPGGLLKQVKEQMRAVPGRGLGYGLLRYECEEGGVGETLRAMPGAEVSFNYLGQLDRVLADGALLRPAPELSGQTRAPGGRRSHLLQINGSVSDGRLQLTWGYSESVHRRDTIERVARECVEVLESLIDHCLSVEERGYTPSDFPLAGLDQQALDRLLEGGREPEDIYPLSPLQQGILFHAIHSPESGAYFEQVSLTLKGSLDEESFRHAWAVLVKRHTALRTAFVWDLHEKPLQVVWKDAELTWARDDWRGLSGAEQRGRLDAFVRAERARGFELSQSPLMRLALMRVEDDAYYFVWSFHHLLLDGWSKNLLLGEFSALYEAHTLGTAAALPEPRPFRDYVAWLVHQDKSAAEAFWRQQLKGFAAPTPLGGQQSAETVFDRRGVYVEQSARLSAETASKLEALGREHELTLNTIMQGAWALLLSQFSGETDVLFGTVVSGRPADLDGVESMVGLFINTLPVRARVSAGAPLGDWLRRLQAQHVEARQFEYTPLAQVQGWSEVPRGRLLFESLFVFENYPIDRSPREAQADLKATHLPSAETTSFPLTVVTGPGTEPVVKIVYDEGRFEAATVSRMLKHFRGLLEEFAANPHSPVSALSVITDEESTELIKSFTDNLEAF